MPVGSPEYSEMLQERAKKVNMNALPTMGMAARLDFPNLQVSSEELLDRMHVHN
jgi:hypothetical protein